MKYKKTKLRPSVGFSLSKYFNDLAAVDLKSTNGIHILHIIDHATLFSPAAVVKSKKKEEIIDTFIKHWIPVLQVKYSQTMVGNSITICFAN